MALDDKAASELVSPGPKAGSGLKQLTLAQVTANNAYLPAQKPGAD